MARRQKYKFVKKEHAENGKVSIGIAVGAISMFVAAALISLVFRGAAGVYVGGLGLMTILLSFLGCFAGMRGLAEKKCSHVFCWIGIAANGLMAAVLLLLLSLGAV